MGKEIGQMLFLRKLAIISFILACVIVAGIVGLLIFMNTGDYNGANGDFAEIEAYGEKETKGFGFDTFDTLHFFSEEIRFERTLFTDQIPNLKIVNSDEYRVEITANKGLIDKLYVENEEKGLVISFKENNYNQVLRGEKDYWGLYVDCDVFDVTVYAPVSVFYTSAEINLDFDTPKTELLTVVVTGEVREGKVRNIDADSFLCSLSGASTLEVSGNVSTSSYLEVWHNSKIDAEMLKTAAVNTSASSQLFGFSYVDGAEFSNYSFGSMGFLITLAIVVALIAAVALCILFNIKFRKLKKEIDEHIERVKNEGKFLKNPEKTDENLLQNEE